MPIDSFVEERFPTGIAYGSTGGPMFNTEVVDLSGGHEQRNVNWADSRESWNVGYGVKTLEDLETLRQFFYARRGRAQGFRFKNPDDYSVENQIIATVLPTEPDTEWQLIKTYSSGGVDYDRTIHKPVDGTLIVYLDSVQQTEGVDYTVDYATGIIHFNAPPASGTVISADFEFDIPVRFDTDHLPVNLTSYKARGVDVPIVEIKPV